MTTANYVIAKDAEGGLQYVTEQVESWRFGWANDRTKAVLFEAEDLVDMQSTFTMWVQQLIMQGVPPIIYNIKSDTHVTAEELFRFQERYWKRLRYTKPDPNIPI